VIRGAHLVRLAALSPQTPGHGHVHYRNRRCG
jgi:hypothetical protein